jgi:hypothetical protein
MNLTDTAQPKDQCLFESRQKPPFLIGFFDLSLAGSM